LSLIGFTSRTVESFRSRRSFMSSSLWTPYVYGSTSLVRCRFSLSWYKADGSQTLGLRGSNPSSVFVSQKVVVKLFYRSQSPRKSVNLSFTISNIKNKSTDLCGNSLLQSIFMNTFCEMSLQESRGAWCYTSWYHHHTTQNASIQWFKGVNSATKSSTHCSLLPIKTTS